MIVTVVPARNVPMTEHTAFAALLLAVVAVRLAVAGTVFGPALPVDDSAKLYVPAGVVWIKPLTELEPDAVVRELHDRLVRRITDGDGYHDLCGREIRRRARVRPDDRIHVAGIWVAVIAVTFSAASPTS